MIDISMLQVGDKIRVVDAWPEEGRYNDIGLMDKYLGQILTVRTTNTDEGYCCVYEDMHDRPEPMGWCWYSELIDEIVSEEDEVDDCEPSDLDELKAFLGLR